MSSIPPSTSLTPAYAATPVAPPPPGGYVWQRYLNVLSSSYEGDYHTHFNPQLLEVCRQPPKRLLDIGCASGILGKFVKEKCGAYVMGIEPNVAAAEAAKKNLDRAWVGKFEDIDLVAEGVPHHSIDTIVTADVLEHMYDPWNTVLNLKRFMTPDGQLIISIPNTRHINLLARLIDGGEWTYDDRGLLDITHIRFFTLKEMTRMLGETGYHVERVAYNLDPSFEEFYKAAKDRPEINLRVGRMALEGISQQELTELCTWQFFIRARPVF
jgi:2-polyprenyl-3-methyl-5-hydroxy-6-metoxy-1,4-benzoquinol methylase